MWNRLNIVLTAVLVVVAMLSLAMRVDYTRPNIEILPDMKYSPASLAYSRNTVFANGRTMQSPVPGTIARGQLPLHFVATKEDALRAGEVLSTPYMGTDDEALLKDSVRRGGIAFRVYCVVCHGASGNGDGMVAQRGFPPPPSLLSGNSLKMKDGQIFHILSFGQGNMPDFAAQLPPALRWDLVNFVRSMQPAPDLSHDEPIGQNSGVQTVDSQAVDGPSENQHADPE